MVGRCDEWVRVGAWISVKNCLVLVRQSMRMKNAVAIWTVPKCVELDLLSRMCMIAELVHWA